MVYWGFSSDEKTHQNEHDDRNRLFSHASFGRREKRFVSIVSSTGIQLDRRHFVSTWSPTLKDVTDACSCLQWTINLPLRTWTCGWKRCETWTNRCWIPESSKYYYCRKQGWYFQILMVRPKIKDRVVCKELWASRLLHKRIELHGYQWCLWVW